MKTAETGRLGEALAEQHLDGIGYAILERNWRCEYGEIDLIARDDDGTVVVVEVKARHGLGVDPFEAITPRKLARLRALASVWARENGVPQGMLRLDAISVHLSGGRPPVIRHLEGIF